VNRFPFPIKSGSACAAIFLTLLFSGPAFGKNILEGLAFRHLIQQETAYRVGSAPAFTKLLTFYQLEAQYRYSYDVRFTAIGRVSYDAIHDLQNLTKTNPFQDRFVTVPPKITEDTDAFDADIREFYGDFSFENMDLRIGKQIVRWGVIEGFRITDELNPIDFDEFILRELTDRHIPLWMMKLDRYIGEYALQLVWIPELVFHRPAPEGTEFEQFQIPPGLEEPAKTFENTEIGLRLSRYVAGFDLSFSYFDGWDDFPTASQTLFGVGSSGRSSDTPTRYHRIKTFGFTWTKGLGAELIKGEFAYVRGRAFGTFSSAAQVEIERPQFKYALGWDTRASFGIEAFFQFSQQWIQDHQDEIIADEFDSGASLTLRKKLLNERVLLKLLTIYIVNDEEVLIRPRVDYRWDDHLLLSLGADIFEGKEGNIQQDDFRFIGFFDKNDRIYTELRYSF